MPGRSSNSGADRARRLRPRPDGPLRARRGQIVEGGSVVLTGSVADPGRLDRQTVDIAWGDGSHSTAPVDAVHHTFRATHLYSDNPLLTDVGLDSIAVTATDNDGAVGPPSGIGLAIANLPPTAQIRSGGLDSSGHVILSALVGDPGPVDATDLVESWTLYDGNNQVIQTGSGLNFTIAGSPSSPEKVVLTVTDHDGATATATDQLDVLTPNDDTYEVPAPTFAGVGAILVLGLGGNDLIAAGHLVRDGSGAIVTDAHGLPEVTDPLTSP